MRKPADDEPRFDQSAGTEVLGGKAVGTPGHAGAVGWLPGPAARVVKRRGGRTRVPIPATCCRLAGELPAVAIGQGEVRPLCAC